MTQHTHANGTPIFPMRDQGTPRPWKVGEEGLSFVNVVSTEMFCIARVSGFAMPDARENADLIVAAVNERAGLLAKNQVLREAVTRLGRWVGVGVADNLFAACVAPQQARIDLDFAHAALSQARGGKETT